MFFLRLISAPGIRRAIRAETTKIEAYNDFLAWITFGGPVVKSGDPVEQEKQLKYASLVANAVMLSNVADLSDVLAGMTHDGHPVIPGLAACRSPLHPGSYPPVRALFPGHGGRPSTTEPGPRPWPGGLVTYFYTYVQLIPCCGADSTSALTGIERLTAVACSAPSNRQKHEAVADQVVYSRQRKKDNTYDDQEQSDNDV